MIVLILILGVLVVVLFWQPSMSSNYRVSRPIKPTKKEMYIKRINELVRQKEYGRVIDLLSKTKYSKDDLPWDYWKEEIHSEVERIIEESERLKDLKNLEEMLGS